jgi:hypothetical protein
MLGNDVINDELKKFTLKTETKDLINWIYSDSVKSWISSVGIQTKASGGITSYDYMSVDYTGQDEKIISAVRTIQNYRCKLEDLIFFGFLKDFVSKASIDELAPAMMATSMGIKDLTLIDKFLTHLRAVKFDVVESSVKTIISRLNAFLASTLENSVLDQVGAAIGSKGSYTMKMFEVAESRANSYGRKAFKEYLQFISNNSIKNA